jgi:hypothetical protein
MRHLVGASAISLITVLQLASGALAQDTSPSPAAPDGAAGSGAPVASARPTGEAIPYAEYVAALKGFTATDPFGEMGDPPTKEQVVAGFRNLVDRAADEQVRLEAVVPEDCYAAAHEELLRYWRSSIEVTAEAATRLEAAASVEEVLPISTAMDEILYARHPIAYVEVEDGSGGFRGSPFNILTALATCPAEAGSSTGRSPAP